MRYLVVLCLLCLSFSIKAQSIKEELYADTLILPEGSAKIKVDWYSTNDCQRGLPSNNKIACGSMTMLSNGVQSTAVSDGKVIAYAESCSKTSTGTMKTQQKESPVRTLHLRLFAESKGKSKTLIRFEASYQHTVGFNRYTLGDCNLDTPVIEHYRSGAVPLLLTQGSSAPVYLNAHNYFNVTLVEALDPLLPMAFTPAKSK